MSRFRDDDEGYYGGRVAPRGGWGSEDRPDTTRSDYDRASRLREREIGNRDAGYDDSYGAGGRSPGGERADYGRGDYGRSYGRGRYGERADYDRGEPRYGTGEINRRGDGRSHERDYGRDEGNGRSLWDEGRDYARRTFGGRGRRTGRSRLRCREIMTRDLAVATRDTPLIDVAAMMKDEDTGVIPVVEYDGTAVTSGEANDAGNTRTATGIRGHGRLVGLITDRDIVVRAIAEGKDPRATRAEEVMTTDMHTAKPNDRVVDAIRTMGDKQVRRIPVVGDNGQLRGIISMADVAIETEDDTELAEALEEISSGSSFWNKIFG
ncbi:MAG TPA: CBS domain-containing protein [Pyrinomonadaceae bacterium]|nr:CBS domain-containing protein [Pyrinomonadaceae bacterium]